MTDILPVKLSMKHRDIIESIRSKNKVFTDTGSFNSCYLWSKALDIKMLIGNNFYTFKENCYPDNVWTFPIGSYNSKKHFVRNLIETVPGLAFIKVKHEDKEFLQKEFPNVFSIKDSPNNNEFIYDAREYELMKGKKFSKLRCKINKFTRENSVSIVDINKNNFGDVINVLKEWALSRSKAGEQETIGNEIDKVLLSNYNSLGMFGVLLFVNGKPSGVSIGYGLNADTCDVVVTRCVGSQRDIGKIAFKEFFLRFGSTYRYFNLGEDGGIEGLRSLKLELKPCRIEKMWKAKLKM